MLRHYLLLSLKVLRRRPFFTFISIFGISFTLLVLMVVAAVLDQRFAAGVPETHQDRMLASTDATFSGRNGGLCCGAGFQLYDRYARNLPGVEHLSIYSSGDSVDSYVDGRKIQSRLKRTDAEFWQVFDFTFLEGRPYSSAEVDADAFLAVITRTTRDRFFGGQSAAGKTIDADGQRFRVVGVVEDVSTLRQLPYAEMWAPYTTAKSDSYRQGLRGGFNSVLLAANGASLSEIHDEFNARVSRIDTAQLSELDGLIHIVAPFETTLQAFARQSPFADTRDASPQTAKAITFIVAVASLFVLLPTLNLININISRIMERAPEIGVRKAFGASSRALVTQFVLENVILTLIGGLVGFVLSALVLRSLNQSGAFPHSQLSINARVFVSGLLMAAVFGIVSGVYPAWRMARLHPIQALRGGERA